MEATCGLFGFRVGGFKEWAELVQASLVAQGGEKAGDEGVEWMGHVEKSRF